MFLCNLVFSSISYSGAVKVMRVKDFLTLKYSASIHNAFSLDTGKIHPSIYLNEEQMALT